jgi:hypothetical protein
MPHFSQRRKERYMDKRQEAARLVELERDLTQQEQAVLSEWFEELPWGLQGRVVQRLGPRIWLGRDFTPEEKASLDKWFYEGEFPQGLDARILRRVCHSDELTRELAERQKEHLAWEINALRLRDKWGA